jgi:hypothetical protein
LEVGSGGVEGRSREEVAQTMCTRVGKCKNGKIKERKKFYLLEKPRK